MIDHPKKWDIALVTPLWLSYSASLANGVTAYVEEHPEFHLCELPMETYGDHSKLANTKMDGVIVWANQRDRWAVDLWRQGFPIVNCGTDLIADKVPMVATATMTREAVDFLKELDRRSLAFVCPNPEVQKGWAPRRDEFLEIAGATGLHTSFCPYVGPDPSDYPEVLAQEIDEPVLLDFLGKLPKPAAVWCAYDSIAVMVYRIARQGGLRVPEDLAVLGMGNSRIGRTSNPPISTFEIPGVRIGYLAMALLHRLLRGESIPKERLQTYIPVTPVIARESTGHGDRRDESIHIAHKLIVKHAHEGITVNEVVNMTKLSRQTFHKRFVDAFGCTPAQKIRSLRLEKAKELLATTDLAVTRIGDYCGFSEQSKFYNFFKREAKCSPSEWRDQARAEENRSS